MNKRTKEKLLDAIRSSIKDLDEVENLRDQFERGLPYHYERQKSEAYERFGNALDDYFAEAIERHSASYRRLEPLE